MILKPSVIETLENQKSRLSTAERGLRNFEDKRAFPIVTASGVAGGTSTGIMTSSKHRPFYPCVIYGATIEFGQASSTNSRFNVVVDDAVEFVMFVPAGARFVRYDFPSEKLLNGQNVLWVTSNQIDEAEASSITINFYGNAQEKLTQSILFEFDETFSLIDGPVSNIEIQPDGSVLIVGAFSNVQGHLVPGFARLSSTGKVDRSFVPAVANASGLEENGERPLIKNISVVKALSNGKIVVGGNVGSGLAVLSADGSLDNSHYLTSLGLPRIFDSIIAFDDGTIFARQIYVESESWDFPFENIYTFRWIDSSGNFMANPYSPEDMVAFEVAGFFNSTGGRTLRRAGDKIYSIRRVFNEETVFRFNASYDSPSSPEVLEKEMEFGYSGMAQSDNPIFFNENITFEGTPTKVPTDPALSQFANPQRGEFHRDGNLSYAIDWIPIEVGDDPLLVNFGKRRFSPSGEPVEDPGGLPSWLFPEPAPVDSDLRMFILDTNTGQKSFVSWGDFVPERISTESTLTPNGAFYSDGFIFVAVEKALEVGERLRVSGLLKIDAETLQPVDFINLIKLDEEENQFVYYSTNGEYTVFGDDSFDLTSERPIYLDVLIDEETGAAVGEMQIGSLGRMRQPNDSPWFDYLSWPQYFSFEVGEVSGTIPLDGSTGTITAELPTKLLDYSEQPGWSTGWELGAIFNLGTTTISFSVSLDVETGALSILSDPFTLNDKIDDPLPERPSWIETLDDLVLPISGVTLQATLEPKDAEFFVTEPFLGIPDFGGYNSIQAKFYDYFYSGFALSINNFYQLDNFLYVFGIERYFADESPYPKSVLLKINLLEMSFEELAAPEILDFDWSVVETFDYPVTTNESGSKTFVVSYEGDDYTLSLGQRIIGRKDFYGYDSKFYIVEFPIIFEVLFPVELEEIRVNVIFKNYRIYKFSSDEFDSYETLDVTESNEFMREFVYIENGFGLARASLSVDNAKPETKLWHLVNLNDLSISETISIEENESDYPVIGFPFYSDGEYFYVRVEEEYAFKYDCETLEFVESVPYVFRGGIFDGGIERWNGPDDSDIALPRSKVFDAAELSDGSVLVGGSFLGETEELPNVGSLVRLTPEFDIDLTFLAKDSISLEYAEAFWRFVIPVFINGQLIFVDQIPFPQGFGIGYETTYRPWDPNPPGNTLNWILAGTAPPFPRYVAAIAVQADGKILVGGYISATNDPFGRVHIVRLNADGSLDTTFGPV